MKLINDKEKTGFYVCEEADRRTHLSCEEIILNCCEKVKKSLTEGEYECNKNPCPFDKKYYYSLIREEK